MQLPALRWRLRTGLLWGRRWWQRHPCQQHSIGCCIGSRGLGLMEGWYCQGWRYREVCRQKLTCHQLCLDMTVVRRPCLKDTVLIGKGIKVPSHELFMYAMPSAPIFSEEYRNGGTFSERKDSREYWKTRFQCTKVWLPLPVEVYIGPKFT